jgi:DNA polymerase-3 subunit epsilon
MNKNILFFDLETTGLETHKARIVEIAIIYNGNKKTFYINPECNIPESASRIHGIYNEDVKDCQTFKELAPKLIKIIDECECLCGYNIRKYDVPILYTEFLRCGISMPEKPLLDVYELIQDLMKSKKLKDVFRILTGKELENAHSGLADISATKELLEVIQDRFYT